MTIHQQPQDPQHSAASLIQLRSLRAEDLTAFVAFWNSAFSRRRNFTALAPSAFRNRVLTCPAFDPAGLIIAWHRTDDNTETIVGFIHAFRPPASTPVYNRWGRHHTIALLYVAPPFRRQGIGSRLMSAAENWLYYCPVHFAGQSTPCYGGVEGPRAPFFGSTQRMGVSAQDTELLNFLANRGFNVVDPGDISMTVDLNAQKPKPAALPRLSRLGLRLERVENGAPFIFREPPDRAEYSSWSNTPDYPYSGLLLVDNHDRLQGHLCWFAIPDDKDNPISAGIYAFWLTPNLRGKGLGALLLDSALNDMTRATHLGGPFQRAEVQTHLIRHAKAVSLYESRGFQINEAWVNLVKT